MIRLLSILAVFATLQQSLAQGRINPTEELTAAAKQFSFCLLEKRWLDAAKMSDANIVGQKGNFEGVADSYKDAVNAIVTEHGAMLQAVKPSKPTFGKRTNKHFFAVIPIVLTFESLEKRVELTWQMVAVSSDGGRQWTFGQFTATKWVKSFYPDFPSSVTVRQDPVPVVYNKQ